MRRLIIIIFLFLAGNISAQSGQAEVDSLLYMESLIQKYESSPDRRYARGYRMDRIFRRREFHQPVTLIPLELHYGINLYGGAGKNLNRMPGGWMLTEENAPLLQSSQIERISQQFDLDLFKTNLSHLILGVSWLDINTGLNLTYSSVFAPTTLPSGQWSAINANWATDDKTFNPRLFGAGISNSVIVQFSEWWFLNLRYTYGLAAGRFYATADNTFDPKPSAWGPAVSYDFGVRFILDPGQKIRYSIGLDLHHSYTRLDRIDDPDDATPIRSLRLPGSGIFLTLAAFYGGQLTSGDLAKQFYYRRDYLEAQDHFQTFLSAYPKHASRRRAEQFLRLCQQNIPHQLYLAGRQFEREGRLLKALEKYRLAETTAGAELKLVIRAAYERLAETPLEEAGRMADSQQAMQALALVRETAGYSSTARRQLPVYQARAAIFRGQAALKYGFYSKALEEYGRALDLAPELAPEINQLNTAVAAALIRQANDVSDLQSIQLAVQSLEMARELMGGLSMTNQAVLEQLQAKLELYNQGQIQRRIKQRMDEARERLHRQMQNVTVGMTIPDVQNLLGEPHRIQYKYDADKTDYQLWLYYLEDGQLELSFEDFILFKIDRAR